MDEKKTVLITGCSSGIGKASAKAFHKRGHKVIATARNPDTLAPLIDAGMDGYALDVTDEKSMDRVFDEIRKKNETVDVLVNNAGYGLMGPVIELPADEVRRQFETNVFAPLILARKAVPAMKEKGRGLIVNIGSVSGIVTTPFSGAYCASKAALHAFSDALRMELSGFGIRVVTVQPGAIQSEFGEAAKKSVDRLLIPDSMYKDKEAAIRARAGVSQKGATPVDDFAEELVEALMKEDPPDIIRLGKKSRILPLLGKMPTRQRDAFFRKMFGV